MKYDFYKMKEIVGEKPHLLKKTDISKALGISRPTLDVWLKKYRRDTNLIKDNLVGNKGDYEKLKTEVFRMKEFISTLYKKNGKVLHTFEVMDCVNKWYIEENAKLKDLIERSKKEE